MTVDTFVEELKGHWSWVYEIYLSKLYERQWAEWELLTIAGVLSLLLLLKVRRRWRKAAAKIVYTDRVSGSPSVIGLKLAASRRARRNGEDLLEDDEDDIPRVRGSARHRRWASATEESDWSDQPVRDLRREIIKRDQTEARLEREIVELTTANEQIEREVAGLMAANERLLRQVTEGRRVAEPLRR